MSGHDTLMWEVRAAAGKLPDVLSWIERTALPYLRQQPGFQRADVYRSTEDRAVVIARFDETPVPLPDPPEDLLRRPVHQWPFQHLTEICGG
ncbi:hypothetical protein [Saccharopolyspora sp. 5N708]|uniref:hypothetical protein n=1 Tax=Saccharopolyspora sp. 5N708 TaxID=3457424 RepID=UPI003FD19F84